MAELRTVLANNYGMTQVEGSNNWNTPGVIFQKKVGAFAYMTSAPEITEITTGGTFQAIDVTYTNNPINGFTPGVSASITYDEDETRYFELDWHATVSSKFAGKTVHIGVAKNAEVLSYASPSVMGVFAKYANEAFQMSGTVVIQLAKNDYIQMQVTSTDDVDEVTFLHFTTTIRPFYS